MNVLLRYETLQQKTSIKLLQVPDVEWLLRNDDSGKAYAAIGLVLVLQFGAPRSRPQ